MKRICLILLIILLPGLAYSGGQEQPKQMNWPFDGIFGYFDKQAIQRGFKVYREVCQACHSVKYLEYRNLEDVGFSKEEVKTIASEYQIQDGPNDDGEMFMRPAKPYDRFVSTYSNEQAARSANNGAYPVDLSLIINARPDGANYVHSILTGYSNNMPAHFKLSSGMYYNPYFNDKQIGMPQPLFDNSVTYSDGANEDIEHLSKDVVAFLQWVADPKMEQRKIMGIKVLLYLAAFTIIFYFAKKRIWKNVK